MTLPATGTPPLPGLRIDRAGPLSPSASRFLAAFDEPRSAVAAAGLANLARPKAYLMLRDLRERGHVIRCARNLYLRVDTLQGQPIEGLPVVARVLARLSKDARCTADIVGGPGLTASAVRRAIYYLERQGKVQRKAYGVYALAGRGGGEASVETVSRPSPIADRIYELLTEPRRPVELRAPLGRSVSNITAHLQAMMQKGRVRRIGPGLYARVAPERDADKFS